MSDRLREWRGVLVRVELADRLDRLPAGLRPTGSRSGLRTWEDYVALRSSGRPASRTSWHFSGWACDVSPSSAATPDVLAAAGLCAPVGGEPWHLEPVVQPWRGVAGGWRLAIADLGRSAWSRWSDPGAEERYPAVALAQAYLGLATDGVVGPRTLAALGGEPWPSTPAGEDELLFRLVPKWNSRNGTGVR